MTTISVTGAAGFIGSHVTERLIADGHSVVGLDNLSSGHRRNLPMESSSFRFVEGDVRDTGVCTEAVAGSSAIVHLAGINSVPRSLGTPMPTVDVNVVGGANLLEAARSEGVDTFVYASSSSVYGPVDRLPTPEGSSRRPLSPYAASKAAFEHLAYAWSNAYGISTVGLRFFNVFGPRQDPLSAYAAVVPRFVTAALEGTAPTIFGTGDSTRDFTYVDNVVSGVVCALRRAPDVSPRVFNIACGGRVSIVELWQAISGQRTSTRSPTFAEPRPGDMPHSQADITCARDLLGFQANVSFEEGIRRTVAWYAAQSDRVGQTA